MDSTGLLSRHGNKVSGDNQYNFVTNVRLSKWRVSNQNISMFFIDYCSRLRTALENYEAPELGSSMDIPRSICNIMQKRQAETIVVYDLHLDYTENIETPCPAAFIYFVISSIQQAISEVYILPEDMEEIKELTCILLGWPVPILIKDTRPGHLAEDCIRYRYMLYFPDCRVEANTLQRLTKRVYSNLRTNNAMGALRQTPIGDWDAILKPVINENLPLYGSSEKSEYPPALYMNTFPDLTSISVQSFNIDHGCGLEQFDIMNHSLVQRGILNADDILGTGDEFNSDDLLPIILYGCYASSQCAFRESLLDEEGTPGPSSNAGNNLMDVPDNVQEKTNEDILNELLPLVSVDRYTSLLSWISIGKAIHTTYKGTEEGLSVWISSTDKALAKLSKNPSFLEDHTVEEICSDYYSNFGDRVTITFKTVVWYAKEDNPVQYANWYSEWSQYYLKRALTLQEDEIAKAIYCDLWLTYAVPGNGSRAIYRFRDHRWSRVDGGYTIRIFITDEFKKRYENIRANLYRMIADSRDDGFRERLENTASRVSKLIDKLGKHKSKNSIICELIDRLVVENLDTMMDSNGELTGLPNGIAEVDCAHHTIHMRSGKPEDYISRTTLVRLNEKYSWNHPLVKEFTDWIEKMFPIDDTRHFVYKFLASLWVAGNADKILINFTGEAGNNSKSTLGRAIMRAWGSYAIKFPSTGLTRGYSDSGAANPAWARLSGPRFAAIDETDEGDQYRNGPTKLVSGNDDFYSRKLFSDGGDCESTATVVSFVNRVERFKGADNAVKKRFVLLPCLSQWRDDNVPETLEEQKKMRVYKNDPEFIRRVTHLSPALLWVSFQYFPIWSKERLKDHPEEMKTATTKYWDENDIYRMYASDNVVEGTEDDYLTITQIYEDFEGWFLRYNKGQTPPDRSTLRYHITQMWGMTQDGRWYGVKISNKQNDDMISNISNAIKKARTTTPAKNASTVVNKPVDKMVDNSKGKEEEVNSNKMSLLGKKEQYRLSTLA